MSTELDPEEMELCELEQESMRPLPRDEKLGVFGNFPVQPTRLDINDSFFFHCHKGVGCWNKCCHGADITLTPYDILRLSRHLKMVPTEFLAEHTVPAIFEKTELPVAKLKMGGEDGKGACAFVSAEGCTVYEARPATCRYYPLGMASVKMKESNDKEDFYFLVKEGHCEGHTQAKGQTVAEFRHEQGIAEGEEHYRGWIDILMKMASWNTMGGPGGRKPTPQTLKMFFLATTDINGFRRFVLESSFLQKYELPDEVVTAIKTDDDALLEVGYAWLKAILFNEPTLLLKEAVLHEAIAKAHREMATND
jgi:Fe-S-cluster containining protein